MRGAIFSGAVLIVTERSTIKVDGFIAARTRMTTTATAASPPISFSMFLPLFGVLSQRVLRHLTNRPLMLDEIVVRRVGEPAEGRRHPSSKGGHFRCLKRTH